MLSDSQNKVTFADVAGIDEAKDEVEEIIAFLKDPKKFQRLGGRIPKGVLMMGPPGTGKTLLARAIAGEAGVPFFSISGSDFVEMFVGVGASRVRDLFEQGKKHAPCIIFIDEIDAVGRHRGAGLGGGHDEREQTLNQLLVEMDGFESNEGVIIIAATNRPDVLDPAHPAPRPLRPPHRRHRAPTCAAARASSACTRRRCRSRRTSTSRSSRAARPGFAGADLENLVNEAALLAARQDKDAVDDGRLRDGQGQGPHGHRAPLDGHQRRGEAARPPGTRPATRSSAMLVDRQRPGPQGHDHPARPGARRHHVPARGRPPQPARKRAGASAASPMALGGRIAEEIVFGEITTGAGNDIEQATEHRARDGVRVGHEREARPARLRREGRAIFLGRDYGQRRAGLLRADRAARSTRRCARIVDEQYDEARRAPRPSNRDEARARSPTRCSSARRSTPRRSTPSSRAASCPSATRVVIPTYAEKEKAAKEKRRVASIFGAAEARPGNVNPSARAASSSPPRSPRSPSPRRSPPIPRSRASSPGRPLPRAAQGSPRPPRGDAASDPDARHPLQPPHRRSGAALATSSRRPIASPICSPTRRLLGRTEWRRRCSACCAPWPARSPGAAGGHRLRLPEPQAQRDDAQEGPSRRLAQPAHARARRRLPRRGRVAVGEIVKEIEAMKWKGGHRALRREERSLRRTSTWGRTDAGRVSDAILGPGGPQGRKDARTQSSSLPCVPRALAVSLSAPDQSRAICASIPSLSGASSGSAFSTIARARRRSARAPSTSPIARSTAARLERSAATSG